MMWPNFCARMMGNAACVTHSAPNRPFTRSRSGFDRLGYCDNPNDVWVEAVAVPLVVFNHIIHRGRRVACIRRELFNLLSTAEHATPERLMTVNVKLAEHIVSLGERISLWRNFVARRLPVKAGKKY
jgi:hypothetical protein